jgi:hypothetical protein
MSLCPLCRERKGKRACPAKGAEICSHCCGTKRLVEIDCPPDCVYLTGAHAPAWEGRNAENRRDVLRVAPHVEGLTEAQTRLFFLTLAGLAGMRGRRKDLDDRLALLAVTALRKTLETRGHGILYDHPAEDLRAAGVLHDLRGLFESHDEEGQAVSPRDSDLLPVLTAVEAAIEATVKEGEGATAFLETAMRFAAELRREAQAESRRLIVEP